MLHVLIVVAVRNGIELSNNLMRMQPVVLRHRIFQHQHVLFESLPHRWHHHQWLRSRLVYLPSPSQLPQPFASVIPDNKLPPDKIYINLRILFAIHSSRRILMFYHQQLNQRYYPSLSMNQIHDYVDVYIHGYSKRKQKSI